MAIAIHASFGYLCTCMSDHAACIWDCTWIQRTSRLEGAESAIYRAASDSDCLRADRVKTCRQGGYRALLPFKMCVLIISSAVR